jgi:hypothetical protein
MQQRQSPETCTSYSMVIVEQIATHLFYRQQACVRHWFRHLQRAAFDRPLRHSLQYYIPPPCETMT